MKYGVVNKSIILNRFVLHTLQRITHLAVITRKTNKKLGILKGGNWKRAFEIFDSNKGHKGHSKRQFLLSVFIYDLNAWLNPPSPLPTRFTRLILKITFVCQGLISPYANFYINRIM